MARKRRLHKRYSKKVRRNPSEGSSSPRKNPPLLAEIGEFVLPSFAAFAATRMLTRMATVQIAKRKPTWAKHAGAIASVGSFVAAWYGANRVKLLEKHHTPIVVGAAIAAAQSIVQLYIPKIGWILADASPDVGAAIKASSAAPLIAAQQQQQLAAAKLQPVNEDPSWYTYDDKYDAGLYSKETGAPSPAPSSPAAPSSQKQAEEDLLADLQLDDDSQNLGIFNG